MKKIIFLALMFLLFSCENGTHKIIVDEQVDEDNIVSDESVEKTPIDDWVTDELLVKDDVNDDDQLLTDDAANVCGDGALGGTEVCDGDAKDCSTIDSKKQGLAACMNDCSGYDTTSCTDKPHWTNANGTNTDNWTGLMWTSDVVNFGTENNSYQNAIKYCDELTLNGQKDWRLPTISELRTLIIFCEAMSGGKCPVTDECNTDECTGDRAQCRLGECTLDLTVDWTGVGRSVFIWSSTPKPDEDEPTRWAVDFFDGVIWVRETPGMMSTMCVRKAE